MLSKIGCELSEETAKSLHGYTRDKFDHLTAGAAYIRVFIF